MRLAKRSSVVVYSPLLRGELSLRRGVVRGAPRLPLLRPDPDSLLHPRIQEEERGERRGGRRRRAHTHTERRATKKGRKNNTIGVLRNLPGLAVCDFSLEGLVWGS